MHLLAFFLLALSGLNAQFTNSDPTWTEWRFLLGQWIGEGTGTPGQGAGSFTFEFILQGKALLRKNRAEYPATADRPTFVHEDLMVIYKNPPDGSLHALYLDNEEHVIHYTASISPDQRSLVFISENAPSAPRYRLSYSKVSSDSLRIKFEIAPPGKPDSFAIYLEGLARRKKA